MSTQRGRGNCLSQNAQPAAALVFQPLCFSDQHRQKPIPSLDHAAMRQRLRAIRVVEIENRCLGKRVGGTKASRMLRIAFDLGWPACVSFDQYTKAVAAAGYSRGKILWIARNLLRRVAHERNDLLRRLAHTAGDSRESQR